MEVHIIAQYVAFDGLDECLATAFEAFEEVGAAESHEALTRARKIVSYVGFCLAGFWIGFWSEIITQTVTREIQSIDSRYYLRGIEGGILVFGIIVINRKFYSPGLASGKVGAVSIRKGEELASIDVDIGIVLLDETPGAPHHVKAHEFAPVVGVFAFFKCGQ